MLFLGRIGDRKGIFDLLEVINLYHNQWAGKIKFIIGGDGDVERLKGYIDTHKLSTMVEYVGWVDGQTKHKLLSECDLLILPSYNEGLPISILEAMSYGKNVIATTVGGIPEVVDNENGRLIEPGNKEQLYSAIDYFITVDRSVLNKMGEASKEKVKPYLMDRIKSQLSSLYNEVLNSR